MKQRLFSWKLSIGFGVLLGIFGDSALADSTISNYQLMQSLSWAGILTQTVTVFMGLCLFFSGLLGFKRLAEGKQMMMHISAAKPLLKMVSGVALLCIPVTVSTVLLALWGTQDVLAYSAPTTDFDVLIPPIVLFVRLIGVWAVVRGIFLFSRAGGEQGQHGAIGRAFIHLLGGVLCVNIVASAHLIESIFFA